MALDPQIEYLMGLVEKAGYPELCALSPAEARAQFDKTAPVLDIKPEPIHRIEDRSIPGRAGPIPIRIYTPAAATGGERLPVLVYYHGGGFVVGSLDCYDAMCRHLALRSAGIVVSVDYRLAPEHKFPAAVDDAYDALCWVGENAGDFGGDGARLALAGDSAGGNLAAVAALDARDNGGPALSAQILIYPVAGGAPESPSHHAFAENYLLTRRNLLWFYDHYLNDAGDARHPRFAPCLAPDLSGLPPALIITAGYDPLRDEAVDYARKLIAAGNAVRLSNYAGMIHGFFSLSGVVDEGKRAIDEVVAMLRAAFAGNTTGDQDD